MKHLFLVGGLAAGLLLTSGCGRSPASVRSRADELYRSGDLRNAALEYRTLVSMAENDGYSHFRLGVIYRRLGDAANAYESLRAARSRIPESAEVASELADLLLTAYWRDLERPASLRRQLEDLSADLLRKPAGIRAGRRVAGYLAVEDRRFEDARKEFDAALAVSPHDSDCTAMLVQVLEDLNRADAAEALAKAHLAARPSDELVSEVLARIYRKGRRIPEADAVLEARLKMNPGSAAAWLALASHYSATRRDDRMLGVMNSMAEERRLPHGAFAAGDYLQKLGRLDQAFEIYSGGAAGDTSYELNYRKRQLAILLFQGKMTEASGLLDRMRQLAPADRDVRRGLAVLAIEGSGDKKAALKELEELHRGNPGDFEVEHDLGRVLLSTGREVEGIRHLKGALRLSPDFLPAQIALAEATALAGNFEEAARQADAALAIAPGNPAALLIRVGALRSVGRLREARAAFDGPELKQLPREKRDVEEAYLLLAEGKPAAAERLLKPFYRPGVSNVRIVAGYVEALTAQGDLATAMQTLRQDLAVVSRPIVLYALAETLSRNGQASDAAETCKALIARHPEFSLSYPKCAEHLLRVNRAEEASTLLTTGLRTHPGNVRIVSALAQVLDLSNRYPEAETAYREWLRLEPRNATAANNLAYLLAYRRVASPEAMELIRLALQQAPGRAAFRDTLGYVCLQSGDSKTAAQIFGDLMKRHPDAPEYRLHFAFALHASGDRAKARQELDALLKGSLNERLRNEAKSFLDGKS